MKSTQKVLIISELFYPSQTSTAYYITEIANEIAKQSKKQIHVYCATPFKDSQEEFPKSDNLTIHRVDQGKGNKNKLTARIAKFIRISLKFCFSIIFAARKDDILFSVTNPAFIIPICAALKSIFRFKYILLAYDIFPENLVAAGLIQENGIIYKAAKAVFDWGYRKADTVISIGRDMSEILKQKGILEERIELIQNWADTERIKYFPKKSNPIAKQYKLENKVVFLFAGNFGRVQGIPELIEVIDHVSAENAAFLFIGDGAMRGVIDQYQKEHPKKAVYCHPYLPMDQQNVFLNAGDVAVATLNEKMFGLGVPSKSYYSLASGHPIIFIGNKEAETAQIIQEGHCGWQTSFKNIEKCAALFDNICLLSEEERNAIGKQASDYLQLNFSKHIVLEKYSNLFKRFYQ